MSELRLATQRSNLAADNRLRATSGAARDWVLNARCRSFDPDRLFVQGAAQVKAVAICRECPVMQECAADALDNRVEYGIWGGMTERQRRALLKRHPDMVSWTTFFRRA